MKSPSLVFRFISKHFVSPDPSASFARARKRAPKPKRPGETFRLFPLFVSAKRRGGKGIAVADMGGSLP